MAYSFSIVKYRLRTWLGLHPTLFFPAMRYGGSKNNALFDDKTEIVIEGFPRSANSFAVWAFLSCQQRPVHVAHHLHAPAQILRGVQNNLPVMALIRHPEQAAISLKGLYPWLPFKDIFKSYLMFYNAILPYLDKILVASFESVTADYGEVIRKLNDRFGTDFVVFEHVPENVERVFKFMEERTKRIIRRHGEVRSVVPFPTKEKEAMSRRFAALLHEDQSLQPLIKACTQAFDAVCKKG